MPPKASVKKSSTRSSSDSISSPSPSQAIDVGKKRPRLLQEEEEEEKKSDEKLLEDVIVIDLLEETETSPILDITPPSQRPRRNLYLNCLDIQCPFPPPIEVNLLELWNEFEFSNLFDQIKNGLLEDLPPDCDFATIFSEVQKCCQNFDKFVKDTEYYHVNRIIDYVVCDHDLSEVPYWRFIVTFLERAKNILVIETFSFDECSLSEIMAIRHGMENLQLLQRYLDCYATSDSNDLYVCIGDLLEEIVNHADTPFEIDDSLYGDRYLDEIKRACSFKNIYNLCVVKGARISGRILSSFLKIFFHHYNYLRDYMFTDQRSLLNIIMVQTKDSDKAFEIFVSLIIKGLSCERKENRLYYSDFLHLYTKRINPSFSSPSRQRFLFTALITFMKKHNYESKPLDVVFCHLLRYEMAAMKTKSNLLQRFFRIEKSSQYSQNSQLGRYIMEASLLVIQAIMEDIRRVSESSPLGNSQVSSLQRELFLFLEIIDRSHAQYLLAFDFNPLKECCDSYFSVEDYHCLENSIRKLYANQQAALEILDKLNCDGNGQRSPMCLLHSWIFRHANQFRDAISTNLYSDVRNQECKWYLLFLAIFDHMKKFGAVWSSEILSFTHPSTEALQSFYQSFSLLRAEINPTAFRVLTSQEFYNNILADMSTYAKNRPISNPVDSVLGELERRNKSLRLALSATRNVDGVNVIAYDNVQVDDISTIMEDDSESDIFIPHEGQYIQVNQYLLQFIVIPFTQDGGRRLHVYGQSLKAIKPRFDLNNSVLKKHLLELSKSGDKGEGFVKRYRNSSEDNCDVHNPHQKLEEAILNLHCEILNETFTVNHISKEEKTLLNFFCQYDAIAERRIASYKYSLKEMWEACCDLNKAGELNKEKDYDNCYSQPDSGAAKENCLEGFKEILLKKYEGKYPHEIQHFENNQVVALFLLHKLWNIEQKKGVKLFRIGTGQGKTLTEAATAIQFLQNSSGGTDRKVIILTAFPHLAIRDQRAMQSLYGRFTFNSIVLNSSNDAARFALSNTQIIYADSQQLIDLIKENFMSSNPNPDLVRFAMRSWENYLVILDEVDVLLKKTEHYYLPNYHEYFDETNLAVALQEGIYKEITENFEAQSSVSSNIISCSTNNSSDLDESNKRNTYVDAMGAQIQSKQLHLYGASFSWKAKLRQIESNVVGFSGTLDTTSLNEVCKPFFSSSTLAFWNIPLFFSPAKTHGDVTRHRVYGDEKELAWLQSAILSGDTPRGDNETFHAALEDSDWLSTIKVDCDEAKARGQAVLIFAFITSNEMALLPDPNVPPSDFKFLRLNIEVNEVYGHYAEPDDAKLQGIAIPGRVTLCCKKVGRGADIRVPISMEEGLHVIVASPDYPEEMLQQIGRTGRMNRKGSYSVIYRKGATAPTYGTPQTSAKLCACAIGMDLSLIFFNEYIRDSRKRKYFLWFIYILLTYGHWKYTDASGKLVGEDVIAKQNAEIKDFFQKIMKK